MTARTARSRPTLGAALGFGLAALSPLALSAGPAQAAFPGSNGRVLVQWGDHIVSYAKSGGDRRDLGQDFPVAVGAYRGDQAGGAADPRR